MVMRDDDVIKKVLAYVEDERYRQAVLIDGEWGAGKTFFVKEKLLMRMKEELPEEVQADEGEYGPRCLRLFLRGWGNVPDRFRPDRTHRVFPHRGAGLPNAKPNLGAYFPPHLRCG